jgi:hypothetical protein
MNFNGDNNLMKEIISEKKRCIKAIKKVIKLAPQAKTKMEKEIVNKFIDKAQKHYDNMYNLLNKSVNRINEINENTYNKIKSNAEPDAELLPLQKLEIFEYKGKFTKLIIKED